MVCVIIYDIFRSILYTALMKTDTLVTLGLNEKSALIYLAGLALGTTTIQSLAQKSGLKRPTVYLHMDELVQRGFFEVLSLNKKQYYRALSPTHLEQRLEKNLAQFRAELPDLLKLQSETLGKPQVRILEGHRGIQEIYAELASAHTLRAWSNVSMPLAPFHDDYMRIAEQVRERGITVREIIADTKGTRRYARLVSKVAGPTYSIRTATLEGIENDTILYGNTVAIFRLHEHNMFVVRIEDATIASTMRAIFDMSWKTARPLR